MSIDMDRERTDGGRQPRRTVERLTPAAGSVPAGPGSAQNLSLEFVDQSQCTRSSTLGQAQTKIADATRGRAAFPAWLGRLRYYGLALLLVGVAVLLRWALFDVLRSVEFLPLGLAWVGAAVLGGLGPGLLAAVTSWLCVELLFDSTPGYLGFGDPAFITKLLAYLAGGLVVSVVGEKLRRARIHARRHMQELAATNTALRESEFHLAQAQQIAHLGSWSWDITENRLFWSDETYRLYGLQPGESVPRHEDFLGFVHPEDRPQVEQGVQEALAHGGSYRLDFRIVQRGGRERYVHCEAQVTLDREGHPVKVEGALQDITERTQAAAALRKSAERLRLALQGGRMGQWEWDLRTDSLFWCSRTYELLGLDTRQEPRIEIFLNRTYPNDQEALKRFLAEARDERQDLEIEFRVFRSWPAQRSDLAWLAFHAMIIRDEQGQAIRMIGVLYDITSRKQTEAELRRLNNLLGGEVRAQIEKLKDRETRLDAEVNRRASVEDELRERSQMLEAFFRHTITPLALLDRDFRFVRVNEAYAKADRKSPGDFVGKNHFALYPHDENQGIFEQVVRSGQPYYAYAKPFTYPDHPEWGVTYWDWQLTPICNGSGQVQSLVFSLEDVTARQKAFREMEQRARQLQRLTLDLAQAEERERQRLAEILHDDLQQVLAAAKFHVSLLGNRVQNDAESREIAEQARDLLGDAIAKSRSLSHELSAPGLSRSDLSEAFEWLAEQMQTKHGLTVHLEMGEQIEVASEPLRVLLYKAAQELLFNASKHAGVHEAKLRLRHRRGRLRLLVSDAGPGFDPTEPGGNLGFGLLSIRERVEYLGGRLKIRSAAGKGSTFLLTVPDSDAQEPARSHEASSAQSGVSTPEK